MEDAEAIVRPAPLHMESGSDLLIANVDTHPIRFERFLFFTENSSTFLIENKHNNHECSCVIHFDKSS